MSNSDIPFDFSVLMNALLDEIDPRYFESIPVRSEKSREFIKEAPMGPTPPAKLTVQDPIFTNFSSGRGRL